MRVMQQVGESSVEEILESIKKVIARDNRETAQAERKRRETDGIFLRNSADGPRVEDGADPEDLLGDDSDEILDLGASAMLDEDIAPETPAPESSTSSAGQKVSRTQDDQPSLINDDAAQSMRKSFAALSMLAENSGEAHSPLESMVRETLRPMLADWLDDNLPDIVEQLVRDEIDRIAGKKR